jgi:hypothetical protein
MARLPDFCPHCHAFVGLDSTEHCISCGQTLIDENAIAAEQHELAAETSTHLHPSHVVAIGVGITALLLLFVVGAFAITANDKGGNSNSQAAAAHSTTSTTINETAVASSHAESLFLPAGDFNPKWSAVSPVVLMPTEDGLWSSCWPNDKQMGATSIAEGDYSYNLQRDDEEGGHLIYSVHVTASTSTAQYQMQKISTASAYNSCAEAEADTYFTDGGLWHVENQSVTTVTRNLPIPYADYRVSATSVTPAGLEHPTVEMVFLQQDSARVTLEFEDCACKLGPPPDKDSIINHAVAALQADAKQNQA